MLLYRPPRSKDITVSRESLKIQSHSGLMGKTVLPYPEPYSLQKQRRNLNGTAQSVAEVYNYYQHID